MAALELQSFSVAAPDGQKPIQALSLVLATGAMLAVVGRSGTGKSLLALALTGLLPAGARSEGTMRLGKRAGLLDAGSDLAALERQLHRGVELLVCDEPGRNLLPEAQRQLLAGLEAANRERGTSVLILTRDIRLPLAMQLETAVLARGGIVERAPAGVLRDRPRHDATRELIGAQRPRTRTLMRPPIGEPLLEAVQLGRRFADPAWRPWDRRPPLVALADIAFTVRRGEAVGLLGGAGAGKSVLLRLVAGLGRSSSGQLVLERVPYRGSDLPRASRGAIGFLFPDPHAAFNPDLPVGLTMTEPLRVEEQLLVDEQADRLVEAVRAVGFEPEVLDRLPQSFTAFELQRLALARALCGRPRLIVLDEATARLDPVEQAEFIVLFNRVRSDFGLTVLAASRTFEVLRAVADRILVLEQGRIVEAGKPGELAETASHPATRALLAPRYPEPPVPMPPPAAPVAAPAPAVAEPPAPESPPEPAAAEPAVAEPPPPEPEPPAAADPAPLGPEPPTAEPALPEPAAAAEAPPSAQPADEGAEAGQAEQAVDGLGDTTWSIDAAGEETRR